MGDIRPDGADDCLVITTAASEAFRTPINLAPQGVSATVVFRAWAQIRGIQHHLSNPRFLAAYLRGEPIPRIGDAPDSLPVLTPIDRWGATPFLPVPLAAQSISRIISAHLAGDSATHRPLRQVDVANDVVEETTPELPPQPATELDSAAYSRGVAARYRAATQLDGITATLDDVEDRADRLLAELLQLLDGQH